MTTVIKQYNDIVAKVRFFFKQLQLKVKQSSTGRPLAINPIEIISLSLFKQVNGIKTKKAVWKIFGLSASYKTLAVNMNRFALQALIILNAILRWNQTHAHPIKHTDSTDVPVCLVKNAKRNKTMNGIAAWGHSAKGWYYGLKMLITADLNRNLLAVRFASGNADERSIFKRMNKDMLGIFIADAGFLSKDLEYDFHIEHKRILFTKPRANMKKIITSFQKSLYDTRMIIELNFRNLKMFHNLETSLPRSLGGFFANYTYSLLAYVLR